jgi:hypothetical protein
MLRVVLFLCGAFLGLADSANAQRGPTPCTTCVNVWATGSYTGGRTHDLEGDPFAAVLSAEGHLLFSEPVPSRPLYQLTLASNAVSTLMPVGDGPGEVRLARALHRSWSDSLIVFDLMGTRVSVLSPSGRFVRSFPLGMSSVGEVLHLRDGSFVASAVSMRGSNANHPLHLFSRDGRHVRLFGGDPKMPRAFTNAVAYQMRRQLALAPDGTIYSLRLGSYVVEKWSATGDSLGAWNLAPAWFTPLNVEMPASHREPPGPKSFALQFDAAGRLIVLSIRADANWQQGVQAPSRPPAIMEITSMDRYLDTQVDVYDSRSMTLIATQRIDVALGSFVGRGVAIGAGATTVDGEPVVRLFRVGVRGL